MSAVRAGRDTEPLTDEKPTAMPPPNKTSRAGGASIRGYFRAAGDHSGFSVFVGDSFLRVHASGYQSKEVQISAIGRLDFARGTKQCEVIIPVALARQ